MSGITNFLRRRSDVRAAGFLLSDWIKEFKDAVSTVLGQDKRVLVYSGKEDFLQLSRREGMGQRYKMGLHHVDATLIRRSSIQGLAR